MPRRKVDMEKLVQEALQEARSVGGRAMGEGGRMGPTTIPCPSCGGFAGRQCNLCGGTGELEPIGGDPPDRSTSRDGVWRHRK